MGNIHAGDSFVAKSVSVQNVAPNTGYYENLEAAAENWDVTILPGNSANLSAGIVDNAPGGGRAGDGQLHLEGNRRRSVGHAVVLADGARHRQRLRLRRGEHARRADDLGNIHAGDSFVAQNLSVQNVAPNTGYYENLEAAAGNWDVTILPGNSANLSAGIGDSTPGARTSR